jgi:hypothetical protein
MHSLIRFDSLFPAQYRKLEDSEKHPISKPIRIKATAETHPDLSSFSGVIMRFNTPRLFYLLHIRHPLLITNFVLEACSYTDTVNVTLHCISERRGSTRAGKLGRCWRYESFCASVLILSELNCKFATLFPLNFPKQSSSSPSSPLSNTFSSASNTTLSKNCHTATPFRPKTAMRTPSTR